MSTVINYLFVHLKNGSSCTIGVYPWSLKHHTPSSEHTIVMGLMSVRICNEVSSFFSKSYSSSFTSVITPPPPTPFLFLRLLLIQFPFSSLSPPPSLTSSHYTCLPLYLFVLFLLVFVNPAPIPSNSVCFLLRERVIFSLNQSSTRFSFPFVFRQPDNMGVLLLDL